MKKLITLSLVLFALNAKSQFFSKLSTELFKIKPIGSFEFATKSRELNFYEHGIQGGESYKYNYPSFYTDVCIGLNYCNFYLTTNIISNFTKENLDDHTFSPFLSEYYFDVYYIYKNFQIGYQHFCSHPTISDSNRDDVLNTYINDYHDKFYIKFTFLK